MLGDRIKEIREDKGIYGSITTGYNWDKLEQDGEEGNIEGKRVKITLPMVNKALKEVTKIKANALIRMTQLEGELVIPDNITSIEDMGVYNCDGLTSVIIGDGVKSIGKDAFAYIQALANLRLGNNLVSIGDNAFRECGLTSITIPNSVTSIGNQAFYDCTGLTSVEIPNSVTSIGDGAFYGCTLENFTIEDTSKITSMTTIGNTIIKNLYVNDLKPLYKFKFRISNSKNVSTNIYVNGELTKDVFIDYVKGVNITLLFQGSTITSAKIAEGYTSIYTEPFFYCPNLKWVDYPSTIQHIYYIRYMTAGVNLIVRAVTPPSLELFFGTYGNIYVPDESVEAYKTASGWNSFASKIKPLSDIAGMGLYPSDGFVSKVTTLKTTYDGIKVTPVYTVEGTAANISEDGVLIFSEEGEVTVTATYNGESVSRTYSWVGIDTIPIANGVALENNGTTTANSTMSTVGFIPTNGATKITWGVDGGTLGVLCEYKEDGTFVDYWGAQSNPRTITLTGGANNIQLKASFSTAHLNNAYVKNAVTGEILWPINMENNITSQMTNGHNIPTPNVGEVHTYTTGTDAATSSIVLDVTNLAYLRINGQGGTVSLLWCFTDENDIVISRAEEKLMMQDEILNIPSNAKKVVINLTSGFGYQTKKLEVVYK